MKINHRNDKIILFFYLSFLLFHNIDCSKNSFDKNKKFKKLKRNLQSCSEIYDNKDGFIPIKFFIDNINFENVVNGNSLNNYKNLLIQSINNAAESIGKLLTTSQISDPYLPDTVIQQVFHIEDWNKTIIGTGNFGTFYRNNKYTYIVWFKAETNEIMKGKLASSEIVVNEGECGRPQIGIITLNKDIEYSRYPSKYLDIVMMRQLTHLLGFHKNFENEINHKEGDPNDGTRNLEDDDEDEEYLNPDFIGIIKVDSENTYYIDSPGVIQYARKYFDCDGITQIKVTIDDDDLPHWPSRLLLGDYMADLIYPEEQVISGMTLAFFNDLQYLSVKKPFTGGLMRYGKHQGCNFVKEKCIKYDSNGHYINKYTNDFFYPNENTDFNGQEPSCSSGRLSKTFHKLHIYGEGEIPEEYIYFQSHELYGGLELIDFCPVSEYSSYSFPDIYEGRCSSTSSITEEEINVYGESRSINSFCALNTFVNKMSSGYDLDVIRAGCYNMFCTSKSLTIKVGEDYLVCPREGGKIISDNYNGYILCPDYNLICTGITEANSYELCNDIFSCINNQIKENEDSFSYGSYKDGIIKTTQDSSIYKEEDPVTDDFSEESTDGKCPQYCQQCKENKRCFKCKADYGLLGQNEESTTEEIICELTSTLENGQYYTKEVNGYTIYYPCSKKIANCIKCNDENTCILCDEDNYFTVNNDNNKCKTMIEKCSEYNSDKTCKECEDNYGLIKEGATSCILENVLDEQKQYYKVTGAPGSTDYYLKCSNAINYCEKCNNENTCIECINNSELKYGIIGDDHSQCLDLSTFEYYFDTMTQKYMRCSEKLSNCKKCSQNGNMIDCTECITNDYVLLHDDSDECILKTTIENDNTNSYFSDEGKYYSCSNSLYHSVENCLTCNNKDTCLSCKSGYQLLVSNDFCISNSDLKKNKYVFINNSYKTCSEIIKGCEKCTNEEESVECIECNIAFELDIHNKCIPTALALVRYFKDLITGKYKSCSEAINNCQECISETECTRCQSGYELDNISTCKAIIKESVENENKLSESDEINQSKESNDNSKIVNNNEKDKDYDKIKALATGGIILGSVGIVAAVFAFVFFFLKNILFPKEQTSPPNDIIESSKSNIVVEQPNEVVVHSTKRTIHNEQKNNDDKKEE